MEVRENQGEESRFRAEQRLVLAELMNIKRDTVRSTVETIEAKGKSRLAPLPLPLAVQVPVRPPTVAAARHLPAATLMAGSQ